MQVHYFQRYHSAENVATANTMLMLSRMYNYDTNKFFDMLNSRILGVGIQETPEIKFEMQYVSKTSVPDAVVSQRSFKIVVETKLYNQFGLAQLVNHLQAFSNEDIKVLMTLDPEPMNKQLLANVENAIANYNKNNMTHIKHINITFKDLIKCMRDYIDDRDRDMVDVVNDFENYCFNDGLIPNSYKILRAVASGTSLKDNMELDLIYDLEYRHFSKHGYIGLYNDKKIKAVGKLYKTIITDMVNGQLTYEVEDSNEPVTQNEMDRINEAITRGKNYGYELTNEPMRYYMVEKFYPTNYEKTSKYGIQKDKLFDLEDILKTNKLPDAEEIAKQLNSKTWE